MNHEVVHTRFWNNLESIYREKIIKAEAENAMDADESLAKQLPYSEMAKNGWVPETIDSKEKVIYLRKYFEVVDLSLLENNQITRIACRRLAVTEKSDLALLAWAQEAKILARKIHTEPINIKALKKIIPEIREMTQQKPNEFFPKIKKMLADCGIALIFLSHLKGSFLQGASFIDGDKIVVGLTARGKDADKFWFSLFHELAHVILGHIGQPNGTTAQDEADADIWAKNSLIPKERFEQFIEKKDFSSSNVVDFANSIRVAPGIIVGRLQNEGCIQHNMLNELKEKYIIAVGD